MKCGIVQRQQFTEEVEANRWSTRSPTDHLCITNARSGTCAVRARDLYDLVVNAQEQEGRCPLPDE